jgi:hypothetical protein
MGDANTKKFHTSANGRMRKTRICSLETDNGIITEQTDISKHIVELYKGLFSSPGRNNVHLEVGFWPMEEQLRASFLSVDDGHSRTSSCGASRGPAVDVS